MTTADPDTTQVCRNCGVRIVLVPVTPHKDGEPPAGWAHLNTNGSLYVPCTQAVATP